MTEEVTAERGIMLMVSLLAQNLTNGMSQIDQVRTLANAGFKPVEIATALGLSAKAVHARLSDIRKSPSKKPSKAAK